jgi:hypothetical protein
MYIDIASIGLILSKTYEMYVYRLIVALNTTQCPST